VVHPVKITGADRFARALLPKGGKVQVVSVHHQAIEKLGKDLVILATSPDGKIVEGVRHKRFPNVLGVQFHPEKRLLWDADIIYQKRPGDGQTNHIAAWYKKDKKAQAFHRAYWRLVGEMLTQSALSQPAEK
jgi:putative glutamine amidotransferase